jgi:competence protein ComEA
VLAGPDEEAPAVGTASPWGEPERRWLALVPSVLRGAVVDPGRRGLVAVAAVAVIAALVAGWAAWQARPVAQPVGAQVQAVRVAPSAAASAALVVVAVAGKVRRPGLVKLPTGSRVADAVAAAGGALPGVDLVSVNLARKLVDGEQIIVGDPAPAVPPAGAAPARLGPTAGGVVNLNAATVAELDALPGVGPVLAQRIVDYRTQHGPFSSVEQLREVSGIGSAKFANLRSRVTV